MGFKMEDFQCEDCGHITEHLVDSNEEEEFQCEECNSSKLKKVLGVSTGKGGHASWAKWRL